MKYVSCDRMGHYGRLGNQIFQYAALISLADRLQCTPLINYNRKNPTGGDPLHKMVIDECFDLSVTRENNHIMDFRDKIDTSWSEPCHQYCSEFEQLPPGTDIMGYFQHENYFRDKSNLIRNELTFKEEILSKSSDVWAHRPAGPLVSLHVRRTDYLNVSHIHPQPGLDYYKRCMDMFDNDTTFVVFSDDTEWCNLVFQGPRFWIQDNDHFTDLCLMTMCDHHIIGNSSFSWWGAWLNPAENKQVLYPSVWFGSTSHLAHRNGIGELGMCPAEWKCVEV